MCLCQIVDHQFNLVTFTCQHGSNKLYYGKLRISNDLSAYWSYQIKIIFNEQRLSSINIKLTNVKLCSDVS